MNNSSTGKQNNSNSNNTQNTNNSNSKDSNSKDSKKKKRKKEDTNISISELDDHLEPQIYNNGNKVKITNITNIIVNKIGQSMDIQNSKKIPDHMLRDIKALHVITQKALTTKSKHNPVDSIDDERKSFLQFQNISSKKALFIDDNSDMPNGIGKESNDFSIPQTTKNNKSGSFMNMDRSNSFTFTNNNDNCYSSRSEVNKKHIINIININNNYNIGNINYGDNNYFTQENGSSQTTPINKSIITNKQTTTNSRKMIPKNSNNKSIKEIIKSCKNDPKPKDKFIKLTK